MKTLVFGLALCLVGSSCSESPTQTSDGTGGLNAAGSGGHAMNIPQGGATTSTGAGGTAGALTVNDGGAPVTFGGQVASGGAAGSASGGRAASGGRDTSAAQGGSLPSTGGAPSAAGGTAGTAGAAARPVSVLVFSRTQGYRHDSIPSGVKALQALGQKRGWTVKASEDATLFSDAGLAEFNVLLFLSTTGDVLDAAQQGAMQRFIQAGKGFVGVHSASDTEYDWPWYGELVGAYFQGHPAVQSASVVVESTSHPATTTLSSPWVRTDEWYAFRTNPRARVNVLLRLDEGSYSPGDASMGSDHPIAWAHEYDGGRAIYTALGHTDASYQEPQFLQHLTGAIEWAAH